MIRLFPSGSKKSKDKRDWNNCQCSCKFYGDSFIQSRRTKVVHGIPGGGSGGNGRGVNSQQFRQKYRKPLRLSGKNREWCQA